MQRQAAARARGYAQAQMRRMQIAGQRRQAIEAHAQRQRQAMDLFHQELEAAMSTPLDCSIQRYQANALAFFFKHNWTSANGIDRVVLKCNTAVPGSGRPAAAFIFHGQDLQPFDFATGVFSNPLEKGRVVLLLSTVRFDNGDAYAICPATFSETTSGPSGYWTFATVSKIKNRAFFIGQNGVGTFLDRDCQTNLVSRPSQFDEAGKQWIWLGRSSVRRDTKLEITVQAPFNDVDRQAVSLLLSPIKLDSDVIGIRCGMRDDNGDPIGVLNTVQPPQYGILRQAGKLFFYARPNQKDGEGRLLFAGKAAAQSDGKVYFSVPFSEHGIESDVWLEPNHRDTNGDQWFVRYPNKKDESQGLPLVMVSLEVL